jgi:hypothetical protein
METETAKIRLIRDKRQAIDDEIAKLESKLVSLRDQAKDFETAERVLASLGFYDKEFPSRATNQLLSKKEPNPGATGKPPGIPTMPEMITEVLRRNNQLTDETKTPSQVLDAIKKEWWATATSTDISPVMWRMAKEGRLVRYPEGGYRLSPIIQQSKDGQNAA